MTGVDKFYTELEVDGRLCKSYVSSGRFLDLAMQWWTAIIEQNSLHVHTDTYETCSCYIKFQWPLLLTWFNFNPSMDK